MITGDFFMTSETERQKGLKELEDNMHIGKDRENGVQRNRADRAHR